VIILRSEIVPENNYMSYFWRGFDRVRILKYTT